MTAMISEVAVPLHPLERARSGDHAAFAEIVAEHESMVFSIAYHFFNDRDRAQEIAQDAFLQLYRSLHVIESPSHLLHWLRQVTTRRCIDITRRTRLRAVSIEEVMELEASTRPTDPLLGRRIRDLVAGLPETQRIILTLRYQEDLDPSDICGIVGLPVNTVKSHLHRALQSLRKKLGDH
jgi:RNA polymerase sigma-70 factor (ECF subfamily)